LKASEEDGGDRKEVGTKINVSSEVKLRSTVDKRGLWSSGLGLHAFFESVKSPVINQADATRSDRE